MAIKFNGEVYGLKRAELQVIEWAKEIRQLNEQLSEAKTDSRQKDKDFQAYVMALKQKKNDKDMLIRELKVRIKQEKGQAHERRSRARLRELQVNPDDPQSLLTASWVYLESQELGYGDDGYDLMIAIRRYLGMDAYHAPLHKVTEGIEA